MTTTTTPRRRRSRALTPEEQAARDATMAAMRREEATRRQAQAEQQQAREAAQAEQMAQSRQENLHRAIEHTSLGLIRDEIALGRALRLYEDALDHLRHLEVPDTQRGTAAAILALAAVLTHGAHATAEAVDYLAGAMPA